MGKSNPPGKAEPSVSIIVNTCNRAEFLDRLFDSFNQLHYDHFEVVVVNGPSTDDTDEVLARWGDRVKVAACPDQNLSQSRNVGIAAAAGELVAFIDDDAHPGDRDWLGRFVRAFEADPDGRLGCVGGSVRRRDTGGLEFEDGCCSDYGMQIFHKKDMPPEPPDGVRWIQSVPGGNNMCRREALMDIGGFDEFYKYYLDETDVAVRLMRRGWRVQVDPANDICHYKALGQRRKKTWDTNWHTMARSDTYYCLKNGADPFPARLAKTLALARRKHFYTEVRGALARGEIDRGEFLRYRGRWLRGFLQGLALGVVRRRRTTVRSYPEMPFKPFRKITPERRYCIGLLSQALPPDPNHGGIGRYTWDLAAALQHLGHEVHVFTKSEEPVKRIGTCFTIHGIPAADWVGREVLPGFPVTSRNFAYSAAVHRRVRDLWAKGVRLDLIESPNWDNEGIAFALEPVLPLVVRVLSPMAQVARIEEWVGNPDTDLNIAGERALIASADWVCAPSNGVVETVRKAMGLDIKAARPFRKILLGPVLKQVTPPAEPSRGVSVSILFVGRLERRKGIRTLLDAVPSLLARHPGVVLDIVGNDRIPDGDGRTFREAFEDAHRQAPWFPRVRFHGLVDGNTLQRFYRECDLFVAPSLYESFGLIYTEAMMYAKPVVGCATGGVPEVVRDGVDGFLVPVGDARALGAAIEKLVADPGLRHRMGLAGRRHLEETLNSIAMAERTLALYEEVLIAHQARYRGAMDGRIGRTIGFDDGERIAFPAEWQALADHLGQTHRVCWTPGVPFFLRGDFETWALHFRRHTHSGVIRIEVNGDPVRYEDLYSDGGGDEEPILIRTGPGFHDIRVEVCAERNPRSQGYEVWLRDVRGHRGPVLTDRECLAAYLGLIRRNGPSAEPLGQPAEACLVESP